MLELITSTTIMGPILITKITSEQLPSVYNGHYFGGYWKRKQHVKLGFNCKISSAKFLEFSVNPSVKVNAMLV